jgi:superfamily II DNA or RNA helicase
MSSGKNWQGPNSKLAEFVRECSARSLNVYREDPARVDEDAGQEEDLTYGGYGRRQLLELIQNAADAMLGAAGGRIEVVLTDMALYCANEGAPFDEDGVLALMHAHVSPKKGTEIGRFGLGFKSVLGVSNTPQVFSHSGSFGFDAKAAKARIKQVVGRRPHYPVLRVADPLDPYAAAREDEVLRRLMRWATTVVRLPLDRGRGAWLASDIEGFEAPFLLFSPHVGRLTLEDGRRGVVRTISLDHEGPDLVLREAGGAASRWRVFSRVVNPSDEALQGAGKLAARDELPLVWAVPLEGRVGTGRFWAFFPLRDETTLTGIANAPWQINDDRTGLLEDSPLNAELLAALSGMVAEELPTLLEPEDPGWILDLLPARGREARSPGDAALTAGVYENLAGRAVVADVRGNLRRIDELSIPPNLSRSVLDQWAAARYAPVDWCHPSTVSTPTRRARVERLAEKASRAPTSVAEWLEVLPAASPGPAACARALRVAGMLLDDDGGAVHEREIRSSRIVLTKAGECVKPDPQAVYLPPADFRSKLDGVAVVDPRLVGVEGVRDVLVRLGLTELNAELELEHYLRHGFPSVPGEEDHTLLWELVRRVETPERAAELILGVTRERAQWTHPYRWIRVRTADGSWHFVADVLLPGPVIPEGSGRDQDVVVDTRFHRPDLEVLRHLGVVAVPGPGYPVGAIAYVERYRFSCYREYLDEVETSSTPHEYYMRFDVKETVGPLDPFPRLSPEGKAMFTAAALPAVHDGSTWTYRHATRTQYPPRRVPSALVRMLRDLGVFTTSLGDRPVEEVFGEGFRAWEAILPVAALDRRTAELLEVPFDPKSLTRVDGRRRDAVFESVAEGSDVGLAARFYAEAARVGIPAPDEILCRVGSGPDRVTPAEVVVTTDDTTFEALASLARPALLVRSRAERDRLVSAWGLQRSVGHVRRQPLWTEAGAGEPLVDRFPGLQDLLAEHGLGRHELIPCSELAVQTTTAHGTVSRDEDLVITDELVLWRDVRGFAWLLHELSDRIGLGLSAEEIDRVVTGAETAEAEERARKVAAKRDDASRLLAAVDEQALRRCLPATVLEAVEPRHRKLTGRRIAELTLAVYGYRALQELQDELKARGFHPPSRWAGSRAARRFVRGLGFDEVYAGTGSPRRDPTVEVSGPTALPPEHDYQREMIEEIHHLCVAPGIDPRRGLLSLPTGAGKTRVAVQALVELFRHGRLGSPVLWIAQSDELCEQAVQSWAEIWRALGPDERLTISRLWALNEAEKALGGHQVVVATVDKLRNRIGSADYEWLTETSCVIVDEAHAAVAPEYTRVLAWLGLKARGRHFETRCPLIGLTATPFRGVSEEETRRLAQRFGSRRLDRLMGDQPYAALQAKGVLAMVEGEVLEGSRSLTLTPEELREIRKTNVIPAGVYKRIASDEERNRQLLDSILSKPDDWPILLFAASVDHAHTMAALLCLEGIPARSIDANTTPDLRRRYVDEFRRGDIRVLCNYAVLSQGFDAPAVRSVYVARPTFSPNVYQQMIGRGLRGPLNGGKERCLIVNVLDNWQRFGFELAFRHFEHLWQPAPTTPT